MDTKTIFAPIATDMPKVEALLHNVVGVEYPPLAELLGYIMAHEGKRLRPALTLLAGKFYDYDIELLAPMAAAVELLHTATLVHDDVVDNAIMRRGSPTLNRLWNSSAAVLVGDYLFAKASDLVASTKNHRINRLFAGTLMEICDGELRQLFSAFRLMQTFEEYYKKIGAKTASLFITSMRSGAILSRASEDAIESLGTYARNLGLAFQIVDDILDFVANEEELGKPVGNDLMQGNLTLPVLLFLERYPEDNPVKRMLDASNRENHSREAIERICNSGVIDDSYKIAEHFCTAAKQALDSLPASESYASLVTLADYVVRRRH